MSAQKETETVCATANEQSTLPFWLHVNPDTLFVRMVVRLRRAE
jgi:hypothetical protein